MVKRRKSAVLQKNHDSSPSDSETELRRPKKLVRRSRDNIYFSSTPHANASSFNGPSTSTNGNGTTALDYDPSDCNYSNFTSFLESNSFISDDESDLLTVSKLAEKSRSLSIRNDTSQVKKRSVTCLNNSFQNVSSFDKQVLKVLTVPCKNLEVIAVHHPASFTLHGYLKLKVLIGTLSVLGYDVKAGTSVNIFSSKRSGYKKITTKVSAVRIPEDFQGTLESILEIDSKPNKTAEGTETIDPTEAGKINALKDFIDFIGSFSIVFILEKSLLPPSLQFLQLYFPIAVEMDFPKKDASGSLRNEAFSGNMYSRVDLGAIEVSQEAELIADQFSDNFLKTGPRILVHGPTKSGKSTMLRYLIHRVLNKENLEAYYLDTDPGQTEFTPPGVVSLTKVTKPLLGPPYAHQRNPIKMIFTGSVTPATSPPMYTQCVRTLIEYFDANFPGKVLFVNTMGWVEGVGEICFQKIKTIINPTMLIDFLSTDECPDLKIEKSQGNFIHVKVPTQKYPRLNSYSSKDMREFALMSYLGKCQKYYMQPTFINAFRPFCVSWDDIAIAVMGKKVEPSRLVQAIHCSIVALCHVDETLMLECDNPEFPKTLQDEAINKCLGFGLVRAADEKKHLLYIVSPLPLEKMLKVNSLIRGNIVIPDEVYFKQPILDTPLPYTAESKTPPASIKKSVKKRQFIPQTPKNV